MDYFLDPAKLWYLLSFAVFLAIILKYGWPVLIAFLDQRIEAIRSEIETAETLRIEAQELLAQYQRKHRDAMQEAEAIVENAKKSAIEIRKLAEIELDEVVARRENQLQERLRRMEVSAIEEIKAQTASLAIEATAEIIAAKLDKKTNETLVEQSAANISHNIH